MQNLLEFFNAVGINVDNSAPFIIKYSLFFLFLNCLVLFNVINISLYLLSIYIYSNEWILSKIPNNYTYVHKLLNFYKNIRLIFIIIELIFLLIAIMIMMSVSYGLVYLYITNK